MIKNNGFIRNNYGKRREGMLDFRIETFLCVCKYMNFTKSADQLKMTQPGVSQHIKYLEEYYGDKLFIYNNKKLTLTKAGIELKEAMITIKHDDEHVKDVIRAQKEDVKHVKFGATLTIGEFYLPIKLANFLKKNQSTKVDFTIADTKKLLALLEDGRIDFAIVEGYYKKQDYDFITVSQEKYILVCATDYPLNKVIDFEDLFSHNLILREEGSGTKDILERYLVEHGYSITDFSNVSIINSIHVIKLLVEQGCGISFLYKKAVHEEIKKGTLKEIEISDFELYHEFNYIWRKNSVFKDYYQSMYFNLVES